MEVEPESAGIRACKRCLANGNIYFITNEDIKEISCTLRFREELPLFRIDAENGNCWKPDDASYSDGIWTLPLNLEFAGSCFIFFTNEKLTLDRKPVKTGELLRTVDTGWECRKIKSYRIGEHDLEIDDVPDDGYIPIEPGDWCSMLGVEFSGDVEYRCRFECSDGKPEKHDILDLGMVKYACEVVLNGQNLGKRAWQPFSFPVKGIVRRILMICGSL